MNPIHHMHWAVGLKEQLLEERRNPIQLSEFFHEQRELEYLNGKLAWYVIHGNVEMVDSLKECIVAFQDKIWEIVRTP